MVLQLGVTLDGYVAGPGGEGDWGLPGEHPDVRAWKLASLRQIGTHIMGRVTYEQMAAHWPTATDDYAAFMNNLPKVVFSKTLPTAEWASSRIARGDLAEEIAALKTESGGKIMAHRAGRRSTVRIPEPELGIARSPGRHALMAARKETDFLARVNAQDQA